jgi:hypothetical protein
MKPTNAATATLDNRLERTASLLRGEAVATPVAGAATVND